MKVVIYNNPELKLLVSAIPDIDIQIIAEKDIPSGIPFLLVDETDLPTDEQFETWTAEITLDNCDGVGLTKEQFAQKYPQYSHWAVNE